MHRMSKIGTLFGTPYCARRHVRSASRSDRHGVYALCKPCPMAFFLQYPKLSGRLGSSANVGAHCVFQWGEVEKEHVM